MSDNTDDRPAAGPQWIQIAHAGPLAKPGLEGNACHGGNQCLVRPQREVHMTCDDFDTRVKASQAAIQDWLAGQPSP